MSGAFVFDGLRMHLKARGMTYLDLAKALKISEALGAGIVQKSAPQGSVARPDSCVWHSAR